MMLKPRGHLSDLKTVVLVEKIVCCDIRIFAAALVISTMNYNEHDILL